jgi:hypothetical protein
LKVIHVTAGLLAPDVNCHVPTGDRFTVPEAIEVQNIVKPITAKDQILRIEKLSP